MLQMAFTAKSECSSRSKPACLQLLGGGICGHPSALTGSDSVQRGPNYCLTWLIVISEECIPTEVPGISLTAPLKTYRPVLTSACCYVQRHGWSEATSGKCKYTELKDCHDYRLKWGAHGVLHLQGRTLWYCSLEKGTRLHALYVWVLKEKVCVSL